MSWQWFHRLGSPRWFYHNSARWLVWLCPIAAAVLLGGLVWGLSIAPEDAKQGNSFRIIYLHVPASFLALAGYYIMAIAGAVGLIWKMKLSYMVMKSAAPIGAALTFIALFSWRHLGQAHLGNLLGLGCANYFHVDTAVFVSRRDGPAIRLSQHRCCQ